jgi:hypothetical protein
MRRTCNGGWVVSSTDNNRNWTKGRKEGKEGEENEKNRTEASTESRNEEKNYKSNQENSPPSIVLSGILGIMHKHSNISPKRINSEGETQTRQNEGRKDRRGDEVGGVRCVRGYA